MPGIILAMIRSQGSACRREREGERLWIPTYHWSNGGMRNSIELVEVEFVIGANVDVSTFVFSHVAVFGCRED